MEHFPVIKTVSLAKSFNADPARNIGIKNLSIEIDKGTFTVIMGNSGSGKSTLLYLLSGLEQPSTGSIWLNGSTIQNLNENAMTLFRRKHIGFVFQDHNLIANLSLLENILVAGYLVNKDRKVVQARAEMLMEQLEISTLAQRLPSQVSGGERQRCAISRALINNPEILMADEPTGSLNSSASEKVLSCFDEVHRTGQTVLMVTHDPKSACHGDRVLFLKDGMLVDALLFEKQKGLTDRHQILLNWLQSLGW